MEKYLDLTKEQFKSFMELPIDTPLQMLNLLKFKDQVPETGRTGPQQYNAYMAATTPFFAKANAKILFFGKPQFTLIGPTETEWDEVLIVEYATKNDFVNMITSEGYPAKMRRLAIEDSRLVFCTPIKK